MNKEIAIHITDVDIKLFHFLEKKIIPRTNKKHFTTP